MTRDEGNSDRWTGDFTLKLLRSDTHTQTRTHTNAHTGKQVLNSTAQPFITAFTFNMGRQPNSGIPTFHQGQ